MILFSSKPCVPSVPKKRADFNRPSAAKPAQLLKQYLSDVVLDNLVTTKVSTLLAECIQNSGNGKFYSIPLILAVIPFSSASMANYDRPLVYDTDGAGLLTLQHSSYSNLSSDHASIVQASELMASNPAKRVLKQARVMTLNQRAIIGGSCWDYLNAVFSRAVVSRETVLKGSYAEGPYAPQEALRSGDWVYFINHGYDDVEHSGLFIGWVEPNSRQALVLSYAGENRQEPARYKIYDLSHVYNIIRPI